MSAPLAALLGAVSMFVVSLLVAAFVERPSLRVVAGFAAALLASPVLLLAAVLRRVDTLGSVRLDPASLSRFAQMRQRGGGPAWVFFYSRRTGVIFVRALRNGEPEPSREVELSALWRQDTDGGQDA